MVQMLYLPFHCVFLVHISVKKKKSKFEIRVNKYKIDAYNIYWLWVELWLLPS